jgi:hypothetical protein
MVRAIHLIGKACRKPRLEPSIGNSVLAASFPGSGDADRIRQIFADELGVNRLGLGAIRRDGDIQFAFPIVVIVGVTRLPH